MHAKLYIHEIFECVNTIIENLISNKNQNESSNLTCIYIYIYIV